MNEEIKQAIDDNNNKKPSILDELKRTMEERYRDYEIKLLPTNSTTVEHHELLGASLSESAQYLTHLLSIDEIYRIENGKGFRFVAFPQHRIVCVSAIDESLRHQQQTDWFRNAGI